MTVLQWKTSLVVVGVISSALLALPSGADEELAASPLPVRIVSRPSTADEERIYSAFDQKVDWMFTGQSLSEVMNYLAATHNITIEVDQQSLKDAGVPLDAEIDLITSGASLRTGLDRMLAKVKKGTVLDYVIENGVLTITTRKNADAFMESRIYDVRAIAAATPEELVQILESTIAPESWKSAGGRATATVLRGSILVHQSQRNHSRVTSTLNLLTLNSGLDLFPTGPRRYPTSLEQPAIDPREFAMTGRPPAGADRKLRPIDVRDVPESEQRILSALRQEVDLKFPQRTLQQVMNTLGEQHGIKTRLDLVTLKDANVSPATEIRFVASGLSLDDALAMMFTNVGGRRLDWIIEDGALVVTTSDHAKVVREIHSYDVRGITREPAPIVPLLRRWCEPEDCKVEGGLLVVSAPQRTHRELLAFFELLTEYRQRQAATKANRP